MNHKHCGGCAFINHCYDKPFNEDGLCPCTQCIVKSMCYGFSSGVDCRPWLEFTNNHTVLTEGQDDGK